MLKEFYVGFLLLLLSFLYLSHLNQMANLKQVVAVRQIASLDNGDTVVVAKAEVPRG